MVSFSRPSDNGAYAPLAQDEERTLVDSQGVLPTTTADFVSSHPNVRPSIYYNEGRFSPPSSVDSLDFVEDKPRDEEELGTIEDSGLVVGRKVHSSASFSSNVISRFVLLS